MVAHALQVMDFGYPQFTEAKILSEFIKTDAYKLEVGLTHCKACRIDVNISLFHKGSFADKELWGAGASSASHGCHKRCLLEK